MMQSDCPIFQWGNKTDLPIFEQISMNMSGFFGAFNALIHLLQDNGLLTEEEQLENVKFNKTRIFFRDNGIFQSIYITDSVGIRNKKVLDRLMQRIDDEFLHMFNDQLHHWDHSIEPFQKFEEVCKNLV
ncbi:MAG: hypothetical protein HWN65_05355 [Candidatus Helarchaeota archaeon]|nr:hypothetical protein [Candidatus Helarchaeota archaeon]